MCTFLNKLNIVVEEVEHSTDTNVTLKSAILYQFKTCLLCNVDTVMTIKKEKDIYCAAFDKAIEFYSCILFTQQTLTEEHLNFIRLFLGFIH